MQAGRAAAAAILAAAAAAILAAPGAAAQEAQPSSGAISVLGGGEAYSRGESAFLFGKIARAEPGSYLILQVVNPAGNLCRIQQLSPLGSGAFITESIPLRGSACGLPGEYRALMFYGEHSAEARFSLSGEQRAEPSDRQRAAAAAVLVNAKIASIDAARAADAEPYRKRLAAAGNGSGAAHLEELAGIYADLWTGPRQPDGATHSLDWRFRPALESAVQALDAQDGGAAALRVEKEAYAAAFYYMMGDRGAAADRMSDAYVAIRNLDPEKGAARKQPTYAQLEQSVQNLMTKTSPFVSGAVKEQLALVFARGTAPLYADELGRALDMMTEMRYLEIVSRKNNTLYGFVQAEWKSALPGLAAAPDLEALLAEGPKVARLHEAARLLRDLDGVKRFVDGGRAGAAAGGSDLVRAIAPDWDRLVGRMGSASSVDDILDSAAEIRDMRSAVEISSRITKVIELSRSAGGAAPVQEWKELLARVSAARSAGEILGAVAEFDGTLTELREGRSPLAVLRLEYETLRAKAEMQADYANLARIDDALRVVATAEGMRSGSPSAARIDRIEVLLAWASESAPVIREELDSYTDEARRARAGDILQRAKSLEDLAGLGVQSNRFLPGYTEFAGSVDSRLDGARNMVIAGDLDAADAAVRALFEEWQAVSGAYADDPRGSESGYSLDGLKRQDLRARLGAMAAAVGNFRGADFGPHEGEYAELERSATAAIDGGDFAGAEERIAAVGAFLQENLAQGHPKIMYDIEYDAERDSWVLSGHLDKRVREREEVRVSVRDQDAALHSTLEFTDTREGAFHTRWRAPAEPGLYAAMLEWDGHRASRLVYVPEEPAYEYTERDAAASASARELEELEGFAARFGGAGSSEVAAAAAEAREAVGSGDAGRAERGLASLRAAIDRYLPERLPTAAVEASYDAAGSRLVVSGAVEKAIAFGEEMHLDVYDQRGEKVHEEALRDSAAGHFSLSIDASRFGPGMHAVRLTYHDMSVTDFFEVR